jgi:hypothetical protein
VDDLPAVYFKPPLILTAGCVESATVSAGGPKILCEGEGGRRKKRDSGEAEDSQALSELSLTTLDSQAQAKYKTRPVPLSYTEEEMRQFENFYADKQPTTPHSGYVPMNWVTTSLTPPPMTTAARLMRRAL